MKDRNQALLETYKQQSRQLEEKWTRMPGRSIRGFERSSKVDFLEGIEDPYKRQMVARLLENTYNYIANLDESTRSLQVGSFEKFVFPIVRAMMANLVAADLVTVSPLDAPTGLIFYFEALYGSSKGNIAQGSKMYDARTGPSMSHHYSDEIVREENLTTGDGGAAYTGTLSYTPVRPGTVVITDGAQQVRDDGNGGLVGDVGAASTVNYATGAVTLTFAAAVGAGTAVTVDYEYNSEANSSVPELDLQLTSAPVIARPNKLRARWSVEAQQDLQSYHGINAEVEIVAFMANEIAKEINYKIIRHINDIASAGTVTWERTPPDGVQWIWHKESLFDALVAGSNLIFQRTQRAMANWIVGGVGFCNVAGTLSKFQKAGGGDQGAGVRKYGTLGDFDVYIDPTFDTNKFVMGHKGTSFLDTGYVYAPYLALFTTNTIMLDDMIARKGMIQRTGLKVVNSGMYATGEITQSGNPF